MAEENVIDRKPSALRQKSVLFTPDEQSDPRPKLPCCIVTPNDSNDPSYTNLTLPYRVICRMRYQRSGEKQRAQFRNEIKLDELLQTKALDGVRIHREFCNPIVSPPKPGEMIKLEEWQREKIEYILRTKY